MRDVLTFAEQPCRAGHDVEFGHSYGIDCECLPQKFSRNGFTRASHA
jgi:hypothetical protein